MAPRGILSRDVQEAVEQLLPYFMSRIGKNVVQGDIVPDETGARDLGTNSKKFDTLHVVNLEAEVVKASRAFLEGVAPNYIRNGSFEQVEEGFANQPKYWVLAAETTWVDDVTRPNDESQLTL
uniref:Uncharacterized protein n=1 Tax=viral metagenome TaxID=1070528 RepID=A0A6M3IYC8_9ZZZZ